MLPLPRENQKVSPYFVFYLIHSTQIGVSILGFERYIAKDAGYDAWISIIISGVSINMLIWIIYQILNKGKNDLAAIHMDLFGKTVGRLMNLYFVVYFTLFAITILRTYLEVIQVWVFPQLNLWIFTPVFLLLMYSFIVGGFRVVTGISFLSVIYGLPLILLFWFPLQQADFSNVFLKIDHNLTELLKGSKTMSLGFLGFEPLFLFYPFIKNAETSQKWAHFGVIFSILLYLTTALVTFFYFSKEQLTHTIWATLTLWKIVDLPFIERFEYVGIAIWVFVVIPNLCLTVW
ncbi:GerAB/ArcD/ProY family transporter, partial [Fictibacillus sp. NRS-1165]|uniref:GerAB/ArcD/ProY family transporter n=1 Tax=Fictibacillus sp. NRS-1165 TaxID=3144463 RepID=UPI003D1DF34D